MRLFFALCCFFPVSLLAQDVAGIWKGTLTQEPGGCFNRYSVEFRINVSNNQVRGRVFDYYDTSKFVKLNFSGTYDPARKRLLLTEQNVLHYNIPIDCVPCIKTYDLAYNRSDTAETLSGDWKGHILDRQKICPPGRIVLTRAMHSEFLVDVDQSDSLARIQESLHLDDRTKEVVQTVVVTDPRINIQLYDNGEIDNDTISVFVNNKLLLYRQRLTARPLSLNLNALPGTTYELVMYADNLGLIPPNTALMVVNAGKKKMEVFLSSSEQKSATVRFVYRKPE